MRSVIPQILSWIELDSIEQLVKLEVHSWSCPSTLSAPAGKNVAGIAISSGANMSKQ